MASAAPSSKKRSAEESTTATTAAAAAAAAGRPLPACLVSEEEDGEAPETPSLPPTAAPAVVAAAAAKRARLADARDGPAPPSSSGGGGDAMAMTPTPSSPSLLPLDPKLLGARARQNILATMPPVWKAALQPFLRSPAATALFDSFGAVVGAALQAGRKVLPLSAHFWDGLSEAVPPRDVRVIVIMDEPCTLRPALVTGRAGAVVLSKERLLHRDDVPTVMQAMMGARDHFMQHAPPALRDFTMASTMHAMGNGTLTAAAEPTPSPYDTAGASAGAQHQQRWGRRRSFYGAAPGSGGGPAAAAAVAPPPPPRAVREGASAEFTAATNTTRGGRVTVAVPARSGGGGGTGATTTAGAPSTGGDSGGGSGSEPSSSGYAPSSSGSDGGKDGGGARKTPVVVAAKAIKAAAAAATAPPSPPPLLPFDMSLARWISQGVIMLHWTMTAQAGAPKAHADVGWGALAVAIINAVLAARTASTAAAAAVPAAAAGEDDSDDDCARARRRWEELPTVPPVVLVTVGRATITAVLQKQPWESAREHAVRCSMLRCPFAARDGSDYVPYESREDAEERANRENAAAKARGETLADEADKPLNLPKIQAGGLATINESLFLAGVAPIAW